jgi:hypothetical protein
VRQERLVE